jgi:hypothetical protein
MDFCVFCHEFIFQVSYLFAPRSEIIFPAVGTLPLCCLLVKHVNKLVSADKDDLLVTMSINEYLQIIKAIVGEAVTFA